MHRLRPGDRRRHRAALNDDPKQIVERGYNRMAERFGEWRDGIRGSPEIEWAEDLLDHLGIRPDLLELASGAASPTTMLLAASGNLLGVDISERQVSLARERCPRARFVHADITEISFDPESFDAVVCVYAFNHIPRGDLPHVLRRIGRWLRPDGYLLATFGRSGDEGVQDDFLGVPMFFGSYSEEENRVLVQAAGLEIERDQVVKIVEPEYGDARFHWILARRS